MEDTAIAIYSLAVRTTSTTAGTAALEIIGASGIGFTLLELGLTLNGPTTSVFGIGTPAAKGVTPTSPVTVLAEDAGNTTTGNTTTALAWGTGPTAPTNFLRRISLPGTVGAGTIFTFPRGIKVLKNTSLVLWVITTNAVADVWLVIDE